MLILPLSICDFKSNSYISVNNNQICDEYYYDCIDNWGIQEQSNCCEGQNGEPNWTECP